MIDYVCKRFLKKFQLEIINLHNLIIMYHLNLPGLILPLKIFDFNQVNLKLKKFLIIFYLK